MLLSLVHREMSLFLLRGQVTLAAVMAGEVSAFNKTLPTPWIFRSLTDSLLNVSELPRDSLLDTDPMGLLLMSSYESLYE